MREIISTNPFLFVVKHCYLVLNVLSSFQKFLIFCSILGWKRVNIQLRSEGCNDKGRYRGCGRAYIRVNGKDYSPHKRGHNVCVIDIRSGTCKSYNPFEDAALILFILYF